MGSYSTNINKIDDSVNAAQDYARVITGHEQVAYAEDEAVLVSGRGATVNILDDGAVEAALDFARDGYEALNENFQDMLDLVGMSNESTADLTQAAADEIATAYQTAEGVASPISTAHLTTALIVAGVIAVVFLGRKRKKI